MDRTASCGWLWLSGILPWLQWNSTFLGAVVLEALKDLRMVAAVPGIGMAGGVFSARTWSLCQACSIPYPKFIPSHFKTYCSYFNFTSLNTIQILPLQREKSHLAYVGTYFVQGTVQIVIQRRIPISILMETGLVLLLGKLGVWPVEKFLLFSRMEYGVEGVNKGAELLCFLSKMYVNLAIKLIIQGNILFYMIIACMYYSWSVITSNFSGTLSESK